MPGTSEMAAGQDWWSGYVAGKQQWVHHDLTGISDDFTIAFFPTGLDENDFGDVFFGYANGGGGYVPVTVIGKAPSGFAEWAASMGLTGADAAPDADPDADGIPNVMEYFLSGNPTIPLSTSLPTIEVIDGRLTMTLSFDESISDVDFVIEVSSDLQTWQHGHGSTEQVDFQPGATIVVRDLTPATCDNPRFMRWRAQLINAD